jgi:apolipoprotein N-acyltransferase
MTEADATADEDGPDSEEMGDEPSHSDDAPPSDDDVDGEADAEAQEDEPLEPTWGPRAPLAVTPAYGLATLSGILYFLGFPGIDIWPLSFVALVPLLIAMRGQSNRRAAGLGWMAGFTMNMLGFYWLTPMLKTFGGLPLPLAFLGAGLVCGYQGGRIALCGWLFSRSASRGWPEYLMFAAAFAVSELVYPLLFPWYFGASVHNALPLLQTAELGGPILVGLVLVAPNIAIAHAIEHKLFGEVRRNVVLAVGLATVVLAAGYGWIRIGQVRTSAAAAEAVQVGLVQGNQPLIKRGPESLKLHRKLTRELKKRGAELVVWSEAAVPLGILEKDAERHIPQKVTRRLGVPTVVGTVLFRKLPDGHPMRYTAVNTAVMTDAKGKVVTQYNKHFLLMFGEYLPFGEQFPDLYKLSPNSSNFTAGKTTEVMMLGDKRIAATICYEDIIPSFFNDVVRATDPDLLLNMTNDAWFLDTTEPWIHFALAKLRSVEHRRYLVRATNSGVSGIVDATGAVVIHSGTFKEEALLGEARYMTGGTLYRTLGDKPWWLLAIALIAMCFVRRPERGATGKD